MDGQVGRLVRALERLGLGEKTSWIVLADHGGHEKNHWLLIPEDMTVPFLLSGWGVRKGGWLGNEVTVLDVAPTAAALLGVPPPVGLDGRILAQALTFDPEPPSSETNAIEPVRRRGVQRVKDVLSQWSPF